MSDNISILVTLFETLKTSTDKNEEATQQLIVQQLDLVGHIKHLPIQDLKDALASHATNSKKEVDDCSDNVDTKTSDLMAEIVKLSGKVSKMILVVVVAFTILMGSYVVIRSIADKVKIYDYTAVEAKQSKAFDDRIDGLMINIRKEMKKLHPNDKVGGDVNESIHE